MKEFKPTKRDWVLIITLLAGLATIATLAISYGRSHPETKTEHRGGTY